MVVTSRWPDFHRLPIGKRLRETARRLGLSATDVAALRAGAAVGSAAADRMIENAIGILGMPIGLGLNLVVNGRDYVVPMAVEEPSVVAAFSLAGKIVRGAGGFTADADSPLMIGQVQIAGCRDPQHSDASMGIIVTIHAARRNWFPTVKSARIMACGCTGMSW